MNNDPSAPDALLQSFLSDLRGRIPAKDERYSVTRWSWLDLGGGCGARDVEEPRTLNRQQVLGRFSKPRTEERICTALYAPRGHGKLVEFEPLLGAIILRANPWSEAVERLRGAGVRPRWVVGGADHDVLIFAMGGTPLSLWDNATSQRLLALHDRLDQHLPWGTMDPFVDHVVPPGARLAGGDHVQAYVYDPRSPSYTLADIERATMPPAGLPGKVVRFSTIDERRRLPEKAVKATMRRVGDEWELRFGDETPIMVKHTMGMSMLATLVRRVNQVIRHGELYGGASESEDNEQLRKMVRQAVDASVKQIAKRSPAFGRHFRDAILRPRGGMSYERQVRVILDVIKD